MQFLKTEVNKRNGASKCDKKLKILIFHELIKSLETREINK